MFQLKNLDQLRQYFSYLIAGVNIVGLLILVILTSSRDDFSALILLVAALPVVVSGGAAFLRPKWAPTWHILVLTNIMLISLVVAVLTGHIYQIDIHMYYFSMLALYVGFMSWPVIVTAAATIAVHHLSLNYLIPWAVFPDGADFFRVVIHAVPVVIQAVALTWLAHNISKLLQGFESFSKSFINMSDTLDLSQTFATANMGALQQLSQSANSLSEKLSGAISETSNVVKEVNSSSQTLKSAFDDISDMGGQQKTSCTEIATALEESTANIASIDDTAANSKQKVTTVHESVNQVGTLMDELSGNSGKIIDMAKDITDISDQTNLLALNASIEAARAGESGKGFAVVADEVGKLAGTTAQTVNHINTVAHNIQSNIDTTKKSVDTLLKEMEEVIESFNSVSESLSQQSSADEEISATVNQFTQQVETLYKTIEQTKDVSDNLETKAKYLDESIGVFKF